MAEEKRTFTITKNKEYKKDRSLLPVLIGALILAVIILMPAFRYMNNVYQFNSFMDSLRTSFVNGQKFNGFQAECQGEEFTLTSNEGSYIFTSLSLIGKGIKCDIEEPEESFFMDFGDGTSLIIGKSTTTGRFRNEVKAVYLEYTYPNGKKYSCKTDMTEYHYLLDPIIANHTG